MTSRDDSGGGGFHGIPLLLTLCIALGVAVFVTAVYCLSFPTGMNGIATMWIVNGLPLAALLRTPQRYWPWLILAAFAGNVAGNMVTAGEAPLVSATRAAMNAAQYGACAYVLRRRFGAYFDLTDLAHLRWFVGLGLAVSLIKTGMLVPLLQALEVDLSVRPTPGELFLSIISRFIGAFVLSLPILAITSRESRDGAQPDAIDLLLGALLIGMMVVGFGPYGFPSVFLVMPLLMTVAWRRGLLGSGVGALLTIIVAGAASKVPGGLESRLVLAGYDPTQRGIYMELFFVCSILTSLPLSVARARQQAMDDALKGALSASEQRAILLVESEAAARAAESKALQSEARARESEARAVQAQQKLRNIIATSADIICTIDADGHFLEISENCEQIWGWSRETLLGRLCFDFMREEDRARSSQLYYERAEPMNIAQNIYLRPDGTGVPMSWAATWNAEEQVCHCIGRDMTGYNALAAQAQLSQRMEAIGQLTGGVAHDFNNLLTIVIGSSETLVEQLAEPQQRKLAELILKAAEQGGALTRQLLAFSRRQALDPRPLDVNSMLDNMAPLIRRTLGADLQFSIETSVKLRRAFADPTQTEAAILNLCLNARDAMPKGGRLTIRAENAKLSAAHARRHPEARAGDYVAIHVSDTGTGIPAELVERIFEPFFTTKEIGKGSGLGLSMVYGFIQQSGGHVELETEIDKGSTFSLYLPIGADIAPVEPTAREPEAIEGGSETVLIVEDNDLVREHVRGQFASMGYRVVTSSSGAEALSVLAEREDIDLLFTDIVMPGGMNGRELGEHAVSRWPGLRILYTSGYSRDALTRDGRPVEGVALLPKPYSKRQLSEKVRLVLDTVG